MVDSIDEYARQQLKESDGKKLKSTTEEGLDLGDEDWERLRTVDSMSEGVAW